MTCSCHTLSCYVCRAITSGITASWEGRECRRQGAPSSPAGEECEGCPLDAAPPTRSRSVPRAGQSWVEGEVYPILCQLEGTSDAHRYEEIPPVSRADTRQHQARKVVVNSAVKSGPEHSRDPPETPGELGFTSGTSRSCRRDRGVSLEARNHQRYRRRPDRRPASSRRHWKRRF